MSMSRIKVPKKSLSHELNNTILHRKSNPFHRPFQNPTVQRVHKCHTRKDWYCCYVEQKFAFFLSSCIFLTLVKNISHIWSLKGWWGIPALDQGNLYSGLRWYTTCAVVNFSYVMSCSNFFIQWIKSWLTCSRELLPSAETNFSCLDWTLK